MNEKSTGNSIIFKVGGVAVTGQTGCAFAVSGSEIDMTNKDNTNWKEFLPGRADWTASGSSMISFDGPNQTLESSQKAIMTAIAQQQIVECEIELAPGLAFRGNAFFTSFEGDFQDESPASISWAVRGAAGLSLIEGEA